MTVDLTEIERTVDRGFDLRANGIREDAEVAGLTIEASTVPSTSIVRMTLLPWQQRQRGDVAVADEADLGRRVRRSRHESQTPLPGVWLRPGGRLAVAHA